MFHILTVLSSEVDIILLFNTDNLFETSIKLSNSIRHIMMRDMERTDSVMLVLVTYKEKVFNLDKLVSKITKKHPYIKSVIQNINAEETNVVLGKQEKLLFGKDYIEDVLCGLRFKISSSKPKYPSTSSSPTGASSGNSSIP